MTTYGKHVQFRFQDDRIVLFTRSGRFDAWSDTVGRLTTVGGWPELIYTAPHADRISPTLDAAIRSEALDQFCAAGLLPAYCGLY